MNIEVLDKQTIDKIAAGEVIERPSSVVKELLENSIDAKATAITLEITNGGISMIRITDNGSGIEKDQIKTAFLRHATSKIRKIEDLDELGSLGFRGEALSSIAAVSQVEVITKTHDDITGVRFTIEDGRDGEYEEIGAPAGTTFVVRNLFYHTPARKKFLKSAKTEGGYIATLAERIALSHPEVSIQFISDGKKRFQTSGNGKIMDVIYQVFGREVSKNLIEISEENDYFAVKGYIGKPVIARGNRGSEIFFVMGRYIRSNLLSKSIEDGYKLHLMQRQFPLCILYFEFKSNVDVNVHPQKLEVRFTDEKEIYEHLTNIIKEAFLTDTLIPEIRFTESDSAKKRLERYSNSIQPFETKRFEKEVNPASDPVEVKKKAPEKRVDFSDMRYSIKTDTPYERKYPHVEQQIIADLLKEERVSDIKIIGQVFNTYWLIQYEDELFIMDQHAAHEKVNFERFMEQYKNKAVMSQMISPPIVVELSVREADLLEENIEAFREMGFEIEGFGELTYKISGVPSDLYTIDIKALFITILGDLSEFKKRNDRDAVVERIAEISCKASVKGGQSLSFAEAKELIDKLMKLENPYQCPHGRPTIIRMSKYELEKKFKRII